MNDPSEKGQPFDKGQELCLVRGSYKGMQAWVDPRKKPTTTRIYVIILKDDLTELATYVHRTSVGEPHSLPKSYEEAALLQHPKIKTKMEDLT
jgi:hypothetical protein